MYIYVHVKCSLFLPDFNQIWFFFGRSSKYSQIYNVMKIGPVVTEFFHGEAWTNRHDELTIAFSKFAKTPKNEFKLKFFFPPWNCSEYFNNTESLEAKIKFYLKHWLLFSRDRTPQIAFRSSITETFENFIVKADVENEGNLLVCSSHHTIPVLCHIVPAENVIESWNIVGRLKFGTTSDILSLNIGRPLFWRTVPARRRVVTPTWGASLHSD